MTSTQTYTYVPYSGYPRKLPTASGLPMTVVVDATHPASFRWLWGMTLLERNLRLVERLGGRSIHVFVRNGERKLAEKRHFPTETSIDVHPVDDKPLSTIGELIGRLKGPVLVLAAQGLYDRRLIAALWQQPAPATGVDRDALLEVPALLLDADTWPRVFSEEGGWTKIMEQALREKEVERIDLSQIETRVSLLRKSVDPQVMGIGDDADLKRANAYLKDLAGKGVNDIIGQYVHPPIEFFLTRLVAHTPLTPDQISYFVILLSLAGLYFFASGQLWEGIAVNLARGVIDGVDGKLARLTLRESEKGNLLDHGTDTLYLPLLFLALGWSLSSGDWGSGPAIATLVLQICYGFNRVFASWFRSFLGVDESEFRSIDRFARRFQPKRNIFILILIVAMLFQAPVWGLYGITALTAFFLLYRVARLDYEGRKLGRESKQEMFADGSGIPAKI